MDFLWLDYWRVVFISTLHLVILGSYRCSCVSGWRNGWLDSPRLKACTWRIIPVTKWLGSPPFISFQGPFGRGTTPVRGLTNHGQEPLTSPGMILQVFLWQDQMLPLSFSWWGKCLVLDGQCSSEKHRGCLRYIGDYTTQLRLIRSHYKDSYWTTSISWFKYPAVLFFRGSMWVWTPEEVNGRC